ncbi:glutathione S-transferase 1-like [Babylonia areolata]|uniref:glutathione S-transferase 1-like n=1 Tax=Babylonia areolata TaxID=304850 RepID=UPI003FD48114
MGDTMELYYFPARGRVEPVRMSLAVGDMPYKDNRITFEEWSSSVKAKSPYGQLPYLVYKGKAYGESKAIASFVARECGLAGKTAEDAMRVDEVYCLTGSLLEQMAKTRFEKDTVKQEEMRETLHKQTVPKYLGYFEKMLEETGDGFFVANALSQADLTVYDVTVTLLKLRPEVLDDFPQIRKMRDNVEADARVKAYLSGRPDSEF